MVSKIGMTTSSGRRDRQKASTRQAIVDAALDIARADGWSAVTVRRVADRIEYSAPIIYEFFQGKNGLIEELQMMGFSIMEEMLKNAIQEAKDAAGKLLAVGDAYVRFAYRYPEFYEIMHGRSSARVSLEKTLAIATRVSLTVGEVLDQWAEETGTVFSDPDDALNTTWALVHGLITVETMGRLAGGEEKVRELTRKSVSDLLFAWSRQ